MAPPTSSLPSALPQVTADDVAEAVRLMQVATQRAAVDPRTGQIDMNKLTTGHR